MGEVIDILPFLKGKTGANPNQTFHFNPQDMTMDKEQRLGCPSCFRADGLFVIETAEIERRVPDVTTDHIEYGTIDAEDLEDLKEIGVSCEHCNFRHIGDDWRGVLVPVEVVDESP